MSEPTSKERGNHPTCTNKANFDLVDWSKGEPAKEYKSPPVAIEFHPIKPIDSKSETFEEFRQRIDEGIRRAMRLKP